MGEYRTIVADPPWRYAKRERSGSRGGSTTGGLGSNRAAADNYAVMDNHAIASIPVREWVADDALLLLWVTNLRLYPEDTDGGVGPLEIIKAWGFRYVTMLTWHKLGSPGMGYYFRGDTEHVLVGVRGSVFIPESERMSNHFAAPRTGHSVKPDRFYEIVERVSPEPRLELFARRRRVGWDVWGDEAPPESEARTQMHMELVNG